MAAPKSSITAAEASRFLLTRGWRAVRDVTPIAHGEWSSAFTFASEDAQFVVRFSSTAEDFRKDVFATRWSEPRLPIPELLELDRAFDGFYAVSRRVAGAFLDDLSGSEFAAALPSLIECLAAMRDADVSATTGFGLWTGAGQAPWPTWRDALLNVNRDPQSERITGWRQRLVDSPTGAGPFDRAFEWLAERVEDLPNERHLIHSDLLNFNVLVNSGTVAAVLDWGSALYGDWLFDLAWLTFWQPWYPVWSGVDIRGEAQRQFTDLGLDDHDFARRLRCYEVAIGLDNQAYCAFKGGPERWEQLGAVAARTLALCSAALSASA